MKYRLLRDIVSDYAQYLKDNAAYSGAWNDGGSSNIIRELEDFNKSLMVKYDLRPSESYKLSVKDVGEPPQFKDAIDRYKLKLVDDMEL